MAKTKTTPRKAAKEIKTLHDLTPDPANINKGTQRGLSALDHSARKFGVGRGVVVDKNGVIIAGNKTVERLADLGITKIKPVHTSGDELVVTVRDDLDLLSKKDRRARGLALADNRVVVLDYDEDAEALAALAKGERELLDGLWNNQEINSMLKNGGGADAEAEIDKADELQRKWKVKNHQVFKVGGSVCVCADNTDKFLTSLIEKHKPTLCVTDPPYEMSSKDVMASVEIYSDRAILLCAGKQAFTLLRDCPGWEYRLDFVWHHFKPRWTGSNHMPVFYHNNILVLAKPKVKTQFYSMAKFGSSLIDTEKDYEDTEMGHGKVSELFEKMMGGFESAKSVADPFLGTGACLIACENTGRQCLGVEKNATTLAVALERFTRCGLEVRKL